MITFSKVAYSRGAQTLVAGLDLTLFAGEKVGIVGANGCGKSTLFQLMLGLLSADSGELILPEKLRIAHVKQETPGVEQSAIDYVLDGDRALREAQAKLRLAEQHNNGTAMAEAHSELEALGAYDAESRAAKLLYGLGFGAEQMQMKVSQLSGGWRVRLNLAQALIQPSDLMLLDEPTNHLDLDAVFWLESYLKAYSGTLMVISHDRDFLDALVSRVLHFDNGQVKSYSGNYSQFLRIKAEQENLQAKQFEKQQAKIKHLQSFIDRFKAKASKARQAQSRVKALERMATVENISVSERLTFDFLPPRHLPDPLLRLEQYQVGYGNHKILSDVNLTLRCDSRIGLLGRNGAGKSTLLKAIADAGVTVSGERQASKHLAVGYFAQHQLEQLDADKSAFDQMMALNPNLSEQEVRNYLGGFAFHGDKVFESVQHFSGGEKARLVLALIIYQKPNLILLDEPTNHLDMDMRDALTMAIQNFEGAVVLISHDRFLLDATVDELYLVDSGRVQRFDGDTQSYHQWLKQNRWGKDESDKTAKPEGIDRRQQKQREAQIRQQLAPIKKQLQITESSIEILQTELDQVQQLMADSALYDADRKQDLNQAIARQSDLKQRLEALELEWFELQDQLEQAVQQARQRLDS
jgi:ATP-binding cassette subfamily F protein 3